MCGHVQHSCNDTPVGKYQQKKKDGMKGGGRNDIWREGGGATEDEHRCHLSVLVGKE